MFHKFEKKLIDMDNNENNAIYSSSFKAGRRTYFFDLRKTRTEDFYITITESKKFTDFDTGNVRFDKHRIFLYNEDFENFVDTLNDVLQKVKDAE